MADKRGASQLSMLGGIGGAGAAAGGNIRGGFANLDDAKTLSQADGM